jgi:hypothetical protein
MEYAHATTVLELAATQGNDIQCVQDHESRAGPPELLVVSFLPDTGHVTPLVRLAERFQRLGMHCASFLPSDCAVEHTFDLCVEWEAKSPPHVELLNVHAALPEQIQGQHDWMPHLYHASCFKRVEPFLPALKKAIGGVDLVLAEAHIFGGFVASISRELGKPVVVSESSPLSLLHIPSIMTLFGLPPLPTPDTTGSCAAGARARVDAARGAFGWFLADRKWRKCWRMRSRWKTEIDDLVPVLGFTNDPRFHFTEEQIMLTAGLTALSDRKMINVHGKPPLVFLPTLGYSVTPHELEGARGETLMVSRQDSWHIAPKSSRGRKTLPTRDRDARAPQRASPSQTSQQVITERLDGAVSQTGQP